jgi:hypothetical protein
MLIVYIPGDGVSVTKGEGELSIDCFWVLEVFVSSMVSISVFGVFVSETDTESCSGFGDNGNGWGLGFGDKRVFF